MKLLKERFDSNGRLCPKTPSIPPHLMLMKNATDIEVDVTVVAHLPPLDLANALAKYEG